MRTELIHHLRVDLALHCLRDTDGPALLMLHGLGEASPRFGPDDWPGSVWALDFAGHGASSIAVGGGYTPESLMSEVDAALAQIGPATVLGRGLGGYVALLIAAGRPALVRGVIITDGPGLHGGGPTPPSALAVDIGGHGSEKPDPFALVELSRDPRPPEYVLDMLDQAAAMSDVEPVVTVCCAASAPWVEAVAGHQRATRSSMSDALSHYAELTSSR